MWYSCFEGIHGAKNYHDQSDVLGFAQYTFGPPNPIATSSQKCLQNHAFQHQLKSTCESISTSPPLDISQTEVTKMAFAQLNFFHNITCIVAEFHCGPTCTTRSRHKSTKSLVRELGYPPHNHKINRISLRTIFPKRKFLRFVRPYGPLKFDSRFILSSNAGKCIHFLRFLRFSHQRSALCSMPGVVGEPLPSMETW